MDLWSIITAIIVPIVVAYIGYNERDKVMIKQNLDKTKAKLHEVDTEVKVVNTRQDDVKENLNRIEKKVDKLLDKLVDKGM